MALDLDEKPYSPGQIAKSTWDKDDNAVRTKLIGGVTIDTDGLATEAKQDSEIALLTDIETNTSGLAALTQVGNYMLDYSGSPVTTTDFTEIFDSFPADMKEIEVFDSSGQVLTLAIGAVGVEASQILICPGGNGRVPFTFTAGSRLSIKAISADATEGILVLNFFG